MLFMCVKEGLSDYCYFLELDVFCFLIDDEWIEKVCVSLLEMLVLCCVCYISELGLFEYDVMVLILMKEMLDFFEVILVNGVDVK